MSSLQQFFMSSPFDASSVARSLWLIIALPLLGAFVCGVFGKAMGRANTHLVAVGAVGGAFLLSVVAFWTTNDLNTMAANPYGVDAVRYALSHDYGTWFAAGDFRVQLGLSVDHLSGSMLLVITGVGFLIHLYSTSYMEHDAGFARYFAYLNLFVAMMLTLVLADSLVLLFVGWEGVGLCSYLLIGFWYTDSAKAWAGRKAFVTNRIGDFGFLLGMFLLTLLVSAFSVQAPKENFGARGLRYDAEAVATKWRTGLSTHGPLAFKAIEEMARALPAKNPGGGAIHLSTKVSNGPLKGLTYGRAIAIILLLFLLGAAGKSAQLPLYVWLPDAMAGPTPVSALIHAATMVTAGVYLFCRISYLVVLSPTAMAVIAVVGALTAVLAAVIAFAQDDIKKVLAYSTVSQLGMMFMAVGMGVFWAAFLHVVTHAFFKACLFLGAGSVMHGNGDETDIKKLGGLRHQMPWTHRTFLVATLAITGIVPLSGFFSKDAILHGIHSTHLLRYPWATTLVWGLGLLTAACTAFYMTRVYLLTFGGERSKKAKLPHAHESAWAMTLPLVVLAVFSVLALFHGLPLMQGREGLQVVMENFLSPVFVTTDFIRRTGGLVEVHATTGVPWGAWGLAWAVALSGGGAAFYFYTRVYPARAENPPGLVRRLVIQKFYVDELYDRLVIRPIQFVAFLLYRVVDSLLIDTVGVRGTAWVTSRLGAALRYLQTGDVQSYAAVMVLALVGSLAYALFRILQ